MGALPRIEERATSTTRLTPYPEGAPPGKTAPPNARRFRDARNDVRKSISRHSVASRNAVTSLRTITPANIRCYARIVNRRFRARVMGDL